MEVRARYSRNSLLSIFPLDRCFNGFSPTLFLSISRVEFNICQRRRRCHITTPDYCCCEAPSVCVRDINAEKFYDYLTCVKNISYVR